MEKEKENENNENQNQGNNSGDSSSSQSPYRDTNTTVERSSNQEGTLKKQIIKQTIEQITTIDNPHKINLLAL